MVFSTSTTTTSLRRLFTPRTAKTIACHRRLCSLLPNASITGTQRVLDIARSTCNVYSTTTTVLPRGQFLSTQANNDQYHGHDDDGHHRHQQAAGDVLAGMSTNAEESRQVYDEWASQYEPDVQKWGYQLPEQVSTLLAKYVTSPDTKYVPHKTSILDAGAGSGLVGSMLRKQPGFDQSQAFIIGADYSTEMLKMAASRQCYDALVQLDLNKTPFCNNQLSQAFLNGDNAQTSVNIFDAILSVGTMTYVDPNAGTLREFCRWVKPGGYICYTHRTDKLEAFRQQEEAMEQEGIWKLVEKVGPLPYLPSHPDYANDIQVVIHLYQKA